MNDFFRIKRTIFFFICCGVALIALLIAYAKLSLQPIKPVSQNKRSVERGSIVDRTGFPLAVQTNFYHVGVSVKNLKENSKSRETFATDISEPLGMSVAEVETLLNSSRSFVYLKKKVTENDYERIKEVTDEKNYNFVSYEKIPGRMYPNRSLASQLIGYMGDDAKGLAGIEFSQQNILSPEFDENTQSQPQAQNIFLSIDANLQHKLEDIAHKSMNETQAESMMLIAADCKSGEILSYISLPSPDLNEYGSSSAMARIDRPAMYSYEPGSVFKIFTVGIVYDEHGISPNDTFICDGMYERHLSNGETVKIRCLDHHGKCTPKDGLRLSCNDVLGQISDRIGEDEFMARIRMLGFGKKTEVELPGESYGSVKDTSSSLWSARSKPTIAIGQEISVTALQMVQAATAIANGGVPMQLTFIKKITNKDGTIVYENEPTPKDRVFSKNTATYILSCMETTAKSGTGSRANIQDVSIGVKTGTAQMADKVNGGYSTTDFISSCMAIFPVENPQIVLYIVVEKAKGETYGGRIVAPVIGEAADTIIDHMGMSRGGAASFEHSGVISIKNSKAVNIDKVVPDFTGLSKKDLLPLMEKNNIKLKINGSGWVTSQNPEPGTTITENLVIELNLE